MTRLLREPLVHFLLLGAGLFLLFGMVGDSGDPPTDRIVVSEGQIVQLAETFARTWQRPPTAKELDGLIENHIREEVYYREAMAMELDRDDTIVRRRLRQKLEFLTDDLVAAADPTEEQLQAYLEEHANAFRTPSQLSFRQIYFNPAERGEQTAHDVAALLARLQSSNPETDTTALGDSLMLPGDYGLASESEIARQLGAEFTAALRELPLGRWSGPVESGFGLHLVLMRERRPGSDPALAEIRRAVEREWRNVRREEANEAVYQGLRDRYEVSVDRPSEDDTKLAEARR